MLVIRRVRIKNFRSILDGSFDPSDISIIVGENDVGKSNYIRALNLFFNGETEPDQRYSFTSDFSYNAIVGKGKAKQTEIALHIEPPNTFSDKSTILWKRYWREESSSFVAESFHRVPGNKEVPLKSKAIQWLRGIKFHYVPAIKGANYFTTLLRELHDTLAATIDVELRNAATNFIDVVREHTSGISEHLSEYINLNSRLQLPENLRSLFEVLDFSTKKSDQDVSLRLRGDGIKVRHIPAVLKFLADQERRLANPGKPKPISIWGYEEPENNLEMKRAFEHAEELFEARTSAQIFVTTHSPAFYGLVDKQDVVAFNAEPTVSGTQLVQISRDKVGLLDDAMGLMPVVAPYINDKVNELNDLKQRLMELNQIVVDADKTLLIVAGETDEIYFRSSIELFAPEISSRIKFVSIGKRTNSGSTGSGDSNLFKLIEHWNNQNDLLNQKAIVMIDCDVQAPPVSCNPELHIVKIPRNNDNKIATKGIENLLPDCVFREEFYSVNEKRDGYGGVTTIKSLNKMRLCKAICDSSGSFFNDRHSILEKFSQIIGDFKSVVNGNG